MKYAGIYIHIPFCAVKCMYCDFYSVAEREDAIPKFVKAIIWEIENCSIDVSEWEFDTIFFGVCEYASLISFLVTIEFEIFL